MKSFHAIALALTGAVVLVVAAGSSLLAETPSPAAGTAFRDCPECPEMVVVPAGSFTMGIPPGERNRDGYKNRQNRVTISSTFAVGKFEVTRGQYARFVAATGRGAGDGCYGLTDDGEWKKGLSQTWQNHGFAQSDEHPVVCVNWEDARAYANWLSNQTGKTYRLLTEVEWEYAAKGNIASRFLWGDDENAACAYANIADQAAKREIQKMSLRTWLIYSSCDDGVVYTTAVGRYRPNGFGLYDTIGNAWEWTDDCYHGEARADPEVNPKVYDGTPACLRIIRGGSWSDIPQYLDCTNRVGYDCGLRSAAIPTIRYNNKGFRVARTL